MLRSRVALSSGVTALFANIPADNITDLTDVLSPEHTTMRIYSSDSGADSANGTFVNTFNGTYDGLGRARIAVKGLISNNGTSSTSNSSSSSSISIPIPRFTFSGAWTVQEKPVSLEFLSSLLPDDVELGIADPVADDSASGSGIADVTNVVQTRMKAILEHDGSGSGAGKGGEPGKGADAVSTFGGGGSFASVFTGHVDLRFFV